MRCREIFPGGNLEFRLIGARFVPSRISTGTIQTIDLKEIATSTAATLQVKRYPFAILSWLVDMTTHRSAATIKQK